MGSKLKNAYWLPSVQQNASGDRVEFMSFLFSANPKKESNIVFEEKCGESSAHEEGFQRQNKRVQSSVSVRRGRASSSTGSSVGDGRSR
ncbi:hypothetical protein DP113_30705 [Brasilonema octagenarum UFV-E1]|uniref:Uncharacterized protein n=2 Tax=Brasilonema TaxID=383614 RepID=A0A856MNK1_9CYAN|nr:hypothetical protein [Brasilonema octagenarum UFV-OR1]QDL11660.1 hypothetical protein DP114_30565 [Brasilonema sennae CENA114]QDL18040.1 hypothetical protein DP113_30705 [Brasilonema octagenarum UFV-E1]